MENKQKQIRNSEQRIRVLLRIPVTDSSSCSVDDVLRMMRDVQELTHAVKVSDLLTQIPECSKEVVRKAVTQENELMNVLTSQFDRLKRFYQINVDSYSQLKLGCESTIDEALQSTEAEDSDSKSLIESVQHSLANK